MNRHATLKRSALVHSRKGFTRHTPMPRAKATPAVPDDVRAALAKRSGGWCEARLPGCWGRATDPHHRVSTKSGGRFGEAKVEHDRLSDLIHCCRLCHEWATTRPYKANVLGLVLWEGDNPAMKPVLLLAHDPEPVYLDDAGGWHRFEVADT